MSDSILIPTTQVEEATHTLRNGTRYWILHQTQNNAYIRLDEYDHYLWTLIDGTRSTLDIVMEYRETYHSLPFSRIDHLIIRLKEQGFLQADELITPDPSLFQKKKSRRFWEILYPIPDIDEVFTSIYSKIQGFTHMRLVQFCFISISLIGVVYFIITEPLPSYPILIEGSYHGLSLLWIYLGILASAILHECGHALACKYYGRRVNNGGFLLYYGSPCLYIDTTDIWMAPPKSRIIVSLAGPFVNVFIGSVCSLVVFLFPDSSMSTGIWRFAFISYALAFFNLNPLLEFDGYYALTDILELPNLRSRAFHYIASLPVIALIKGEKKMSREEICFLIYGISGGIFTLLVIIFGLYTWEAHVSDLAEALLSGTYMPDRMISSILLVVLFLPFIIGMTIQGFSYIRDHLKLITNKRRESH